LDYFAGLNDDIIEADTLEEAEAIAWEAAEEEASSMTSAKAELVNAEDEEA